MKHRGQAPEPLPEHVPDNVLDELNVAFSAEHPPPPKGYDFDDPSIDRLLGLGELDDFDDDDVDDDDVDDDDVDDDDVDDDDEFIDDADRHHEQMDGQPVAEDSRRTIVISHEEVPDTVYLDQNLGQRFRSEARTDPSGGRSTVVIGDLDDGPEVHQLAAGSSVGGSMDPRIRARRIANRRAESRKRLIWVAIASAIVLAVVGAIAVVASPIFDVRDVRVQGAVYTDADVLTQVVHSLKGHPVLLVDTAAAEQRLRSVPWVERAKVSTQFPHGVTIDIRERKPVATFQGGDSQFRVIDVQGRVLDVIAGQPTAYALITGRNPDTVRGEFAGGPYASAAELVVALPPEIRSITISIGVDSTTGTLSMLLKNTGRTPVDVRLGDTSALDDKLARLLSQVRKGLRGVCSLDVSTSEVGVVPGC